MDRLDELKRLAGPYAYSTPAAAEGGSRQEGLVLWAVAEIERLREAVYNYGTCLETCGMYGDGCDCGFEKIVETCHPARRQS